MHKACQTVTVPGQTVRKATLVSLYTLEDVSVSCRASLSYMAVSASESSVVVDSAQKHAAKMFNRLATDTTLCRS